MIDGLVFSQKVLILNNQCYVNYNKTKKLRSWILDRSAMHNCIVLPVPHTGVRANNNYSEVRHNSVSR